ncbi:MAG: carbon starvation CstA family protein [Synergistaceae bacterium]|nr:carbon starvation CstA family protein [Synergistaceae bacterium]
MFFIMFAVSALFLVLGYIFYGRFMAKVYDLNNGNVTPAEQLNDGMDYCPTHPAVVLGHHFSSIAGAGPIVGPITAASMFGWLPTILWCVLGSIFLGGPHDFGALVSSMRHEGKSVGEVIDRWIGHKGKKLFLIFTILSLFLVVAVFLVLTTATFVTDPVVAFVSCMYILLAVVSGILIYRFNMNLKVITLVMLAIIAVCAIKGGDWPFVAAIFTHGADTWNLFLALYILAASILPVWLLLQPRDYLASYFLYFAVAIGAIGMIFGASMDSGSIPMIAKEVKWMGLTKASLWPMLFVIVACGAISGFHSLVGSGTTSKQLAHEADAIPVGYGAMLLEGLVAVIAIGTLMVAGGIQKGGPVGTFAAGFGQFCTLVGIDPVLGTRLGAIAINGFLLTSLDTATRLARYQIQELSDYKVNKYAATIIAVVVALGLVYFKTTGADGKPVPAWSVIWPVFGASNQLVAALAILGVALWIIRGLKKKATFLLVPFWFMLVTSMAGLVVEITSTLASPSPNYILAGICALLLVLALLMTKEGLAALNREKRGEFVN